MKNKHEQHGEQSAPNQENQEARDSNKTGMSGMSAEEHAKMTQDKSGGENLLQRRTLR